MLNVGVGAFFAKKGPFFVSFFRAYTPNFRFIFRAHFAFFCVFRAFSGPTWGWSVFRDKKKFSFVFRDHTPIFRFIFVRFSRFFFKAVRALFLPWATFSPYKILFAEEFYKSCKKNQKKRKKWQKMTLKMRKKNISLAFWIRPFFFCKKLKNTPHFSRFFRFFRFSPDPPIFREKFREKRAKPKWIFIFS